MVSFNNLNIGVVAHHLRGLLQQLQHDVNAHAKVCGEDNRNLFGCILDSLLARIVKTGGADHHPLAVLAAKCQMRERPFRAGKIDEDIEVLFNRIQAALYGDAGLSRARQLTSIGPQK